MSTVAEASEIVWPDHRKRWDAITKAFHQGRINQDEFSYQLRRLGAHDGEIRAEIALHERGV